MDAKKIAALKALGITQDLIAALLGDVDKSEKDADAQQVRYKSASGLLQTRDQAIAEMCDQTIELVDDTLFNLYNGGKEQQVLALARGLVMRAKAALDGSDLAALFDQAIAAAGEDVVRQALQQLAGAPMANTSKRADSGPMSAQKTYDPQRDPLAVAFHADQVKRV